jgi:hypothetical protein
LWKEWAENRNQLLETAFEPGFPIPANVENIKDNSMLDYWLQRFIVEIRRKDGNPYPPSTLLAITSGIQRHLRTENNAQVNFFKEDENTFLGFRKALDARMKELTVQGVGVSVKKADPITKQDEQTLCDTGVFSLNSSTGLSNALFFYNVKVFGFRGFSEHLECQAEQFDLAYDHENNRRFVRFTPRIRKNSQGGLKHKRVNNEPNIHYDQPDMPPSIFEIYKAYLDLIPRKGLFYRKPLGGLDENY